MQIKDTRVLKHYSIPEHELQLFKEIDREEVEREQVWTEMVDTGETEEYETGEYETVETGETILVESGEFDEDGNPIMVEVPEVVTRPIIGTRPVYEEVERTETVTEILSYTYEFLKLPWRSEFSGHYEETEGSEEGETVFVDYVEANFDNLWDEAVQLEAYNQSIQETKAYLNFINAEIEDTNKFDLIAYRRIVEEGGDNINEMDSYRYDLLILQQELINQTQRASKGISLQIDKPAFNVTKPTWSNKYM